VEWATHNTMSDLWLCGLVDGYARAKDITWLR